MVAHAPYYRDSRIRGYTEWLALDGAQVDVLSLKEKRPAEDSTGIRVLMAPYKGEFGSLPAYVFGYLATVTIFAVRLTANHIRQPYDIIHVHNMPDFLVLAALPARILGAKVILDEHDPMPQFYMSKYQKGERHWLTRFMIAQERLSVWLSDAVIAANTLFRENIIARGAPRDKVSVVQNIADDRVVSRAAHPRKKRVPGTMVMVYPGTMAPRYGLDIAVKALPLLRERIDNVKLILVGPWEPNVAELLSLADDLGVADSLEYRHTVPAHEVPNILEEADVGIYTARPDPHMSIATPTKVLQYAHMGLPIVAPRLQILEALFEEGAISYFQPGSVEGFAQSVLNLYDRPELGEHTVQVMDDTFVSERSWQQELATYYGVINSLLGEELEIIANHRDRCSQ